MNRPPARPWLPPLALLALLALLAACSPAAPTALDLDGAWLVAWDGGGPRPDFATTGAMTLDVAGGVARFVGQDDASGVKRCVDLEISVLAGSLVTLEAPTPFAGEVGPGPSSPRASTATRSGGPTTPKS